MPPRHDYSRVLANCRQVIQILASARIFSIFYCPLFILSLGAHPRCAGGWVNDTSVVAVPRSPSGRVLLRNADFPNWCSLDALTGLIGDRVVPCHGNPNSPSSRRSGAPIPNLRVRFPRPASTPISSRLVWPPPLAGSSFLCCLFHQVSCFALHQAGYEKRTISPGICSHLVPVW